ncbi:MAG: lysophospholipid acyltransferase family protein [Candidatus Wallbacteria bacterium]
MREYKIYYSIFRIILRFLYKIFFIHYEISGEENLNPIINSGRGAILASNHISNLDPVLYMLVQKVPISFFAKKSLLKVPVLGWCMRKCGQLGVNRGAPDSAAIKSALNLVDEGRVLGIFPEGTRSADGILRDGKPGCGMFAYKTKAIVIPSAIWGSHEILPKNTFVPRVARVKIKIGEPLNLDEYYNKTPQTAEEEREIYREITQKIMEEIRKLYESLR